MEIDFDFDEAWSDADNLIMAELGDDITLIKPDTSTMIAKCILIETPDPDNADGYAWRDNINAKIDFNSVIVSILEAAVPGISKSWKVHYGQHYMISEIIPNGDGTIILVLNQAGNIIANVNGWR